MIHVDLANSIRTFTFTNGIKDNFPLFTIGKNSYINSMEVDVGPGDEVINIHIGNYCSIAYNVKFLINRNHDYESITTSPVLLDNSKRKLKQKGQIIIKNDVWIGNNSIILSGVTIGNGAVIGAGTIVSKDVPPYSIVVGNPQKIIKYRFHEDEVGEIQKIKWWNWEDEFVKINKEWFSRPINEFISNFKVIDQEKDEKDFIREKKNRTFLLFPDFYDEYPVWEKVVKEYIEEFTSDDDVTLLLRIEEDISFEENILKINNVLINKVNNPDILVVNDKIDCIESLFKKVNYYITTRSINTIKHIEYAEDNNVKILSGVDIPIFK